MVDAIQHFVRATDSVIARAYLAVFKERNSLMSFLFHSLFRDERVIVTPHAAFVSEESLIELRTRVARQIADLFQGRRPESIVNPEIFAAHGQG